MRIWAFPSFYPYDFPGLRWNGIFAHRQYKGLIENGAELYVILPVRWHPIFPFSNLHKDWKEMKALSYPKERIYDGVKVYHPRISNFRPNRFVRKTYAERYMDSIVNFFKENNIKLDGSSDIFYSQWLPDAFMVQMAAKKLGIKSAVLAIGDDVLVWPFSNNGNFKSFNETLTDADLRISVAAYLGNEANKILGKQLLFHTIRRGVNYGYFTPAEGDEKITIRETLGIPTDKIVVLTVGSAIVRKGWLDLFDALKEIKEKDKKDFTLIAINAGTEDINLNEEAKKRGIEKHVMNLREVEPAQIPTFYKCADIFCLPSHWEGIANAVVEAMSSGLPVITTNVCGHPELIRDETTGILIPPKQPQILYEKMTCLMNDEKLRMELGRNARQFIVNDWGNFADNAKKLYNTLNLFGQ